MSRRSSATSPSHSSPNCGMLACAGLPDAAAERAARVVYFAYLGIVMTGGNHASGGASVPDQLRDVVRCVIHDSAQGDEQ